MSVVLAYAIIALAVLAITYKTYVGYGNYRWYTKLGTFIVLLLGLAAPTICFKFFNSPSPNIQLMNKYLYLLFGFVLLLFVITFIRDIIWSIADVIRRKSLSDMKDTAKLQKANIITVILCLLVCTYGYYEAEKSAAIKTYEITSPKIKKETKIVMLSDLHITPAVSTKYVKNLVKRVNALNPDAIVLVGDTVDGTPDNLVSQMTELAKLKAKEDVFITLGNHEFYHGGLSWGITFGRMRFEFLSNYGEMLDDTGIYIAGIPDINTADAAGMKVKIENALYFAEKGSYVILLSHTPKLVEGANKDNIDLQLSAHTHGGQIFPFHYFVKQANEDRLAGFYNVNGVKMYVSRGTGYWGVPMRLLAPSEITVFNFKPEKSNGQPS